MSTEIFNRPNENYLACLTKASQHTELVATDDIVDTSGMKLWAKNQPISEALREKLAVRTLRKPIEACVSAVDPDLVSKIAGQVEELLNTNQGLTLIAGPNVKQIVAAVRGTKLNAVEQTTLVAMQHSERDMTLHACLVTAVAIALAYRVQATDNITDLVVAALLHDAGEMYLRPDLFTRGGPLSGKEFRYVMTHPIIGSAIERDLAGRVGNVPKMIEQSHERADGSGYPRGVELAALSPQSQVLLTAEAIAELIKRWKDAGVVRATLGIDLIQGEFPQATRAALRDCARSAQQTVPEDFTEVEEPAQRLKRTIDIVKDAKTLTKALQPKAATTSKREGEAFAKAAAILERCDKAARAAGMASVLQVDDEMLKELMSDRAMQFQCLAESDEIRYRLRSVATSLEIASEGDDKMLADQDFVSLQAKLREQ